MMCKTITWLTEVAELARMLASMTSFLYNTTLTLILALHENAACSPVWMKPRPVPVNSRCKTKAVRSGVVQTACADTVYMLTPGGNRMWDIYDKISALRSQHNWTASCHCASLKSDRTCDDHPAGGGCMSVHTLCSCAVSLQQLLLHPTCDALLFLSSYWDIWYECRLKPEVCGTLRVSDLPDFKDAGL